MRGWQVTSYGKPSEALELREVPDPAPEAGRDPRPDDGERPQLQRGRRLPRSLPHDQPAAALHARDGVRRRGRRRGRRAPSRGSGAGSRRAGGPASVPMPSSSPDRRRWRSRRPSSSTTSRRRPSSTRSISPTSASTSGVASPPARRSSSTRPPAASVRRPCSWRSPRARASSPRSATTRRRRSCEKLGAELVVNYRNDDFVARVLDATSGAGVDVCFDGVGGETMMQSLRCLGRGGRHLVVGFASGIEAEEVPMVSGRALCFGNFDILGVILAYLDDAVVPHAGEFAPVPVPRFNPPTAAIGPAGPGPPARAPGRRSHPPDRRPRRPVRRPRPGPRRHGVAQHGRKDRRHPLVAHHCARGRHTTDQVS